MSWNLIWDHHVEKTVARTTQIVSLIKCIRHRVGGDAAMQVMTFQFFGTAHYCSATWMTPDLSRKMWNTLYSQHYWAVRAAIGDNKRVKSRVLLNSLSKRATLKQLAKYAVASIWINLINNSDTRIAHELRKHIDVNDRRMGNQALSNQLGFMNGIDFNWAGAYQKIL